MSKKIDVKELIDKFNNIHVNKYDYSSFVYHKMHEKSSIICPIHGTFNQTPHSHLKGMGCPKCGAESRSKIKSINFEQFLEKAEKVHGGKYEYVKETYTSYKEHMTAICSKHGEFKIMPTRHINLKNGCPHCYNEVRGSHFVLGNDVFVEKANKIHNGKYDYSKVEYVNNRTKVCINCPIHGEFWQEPIVHLDCHGCPLCANENSAKIRSLTTEEFIERGNKTHKFKYDYSKVEYINANSKVCIICPIHGEFWQVASRHISENGCPKCASEMINSSYELELLDFIKNNVNEDIITNDRTILNNGYELDIYIPSLNIAFEFDGLYWHNETKKPNKNYHLNKTNECKDKGIRLIHIFEDEWIYKKEIVMSRILNILGKTNKNYYARKCEIKEVSYQDSLFFLSKNHIQGNCVSKYRYGLYYNNELISLMTFGFLRNNLNQKTNGEEYEMLRFCNKINANVIGGASKLLKHFIKTIKPSEIISYSDRRWSEGNVYEKLGFTFIHNTIPNYFYVFGDKRENRFKFRKDVLVKEGFDANKSEHEIMLNRKIYRIYDCGTKLFKLIGLKY